MVHLVYTVIIKTEKSNAFYNSLCIKVLYTWSYRKYNMSTLFDLMTRDSRFTILVEIFTNHISLENSYFTNHIE